MMKASRMGIPLRSARGFAVVVLAALVLIAILLLIRNGNTLPQRRSAVVLTAPEEVRANYSAREQLQPTAFDKFPYGMTKMTFERGRDIYLYDLVKKEIKRIADGYEPRISPAGDFARQV